MTFMQAAVKAEGKDGTVKEEHDLLYCTGITKVQCPMSKTAAVKIYLPFQEAYSLDM